MCYTVTKKSLAEMPAYVKIPVIINYVFVVHFGLSYFMVAFTLLTFQRFHKVDHGINSVSYSYQRSVMETRRQGLFGL